MASLALTAFNDFVDGLAINAANKTRLKERGEVFYVQVVKEEARHIRKHLQAAVAAGGDPDRAALWDAILQRVIDEDERLTLETAAGL